MSFTKGTSSFVSINGSSLSAWADNIEFTYKADDLDVTTFGQTSHVRQAGLFDGTLTVAGTYENSTTGPHDVIIPLLGTVVSSCTFRPEGTGSGLPEVTGSVLVSNYQETAAVADMVKWSVDLMFSGARTSTNQ